MRRVRGGMYIKSELMPIEARTQMRSRGRLYGVPRYCIRSGMLADIHPESAGDIRGGRLLTGARNLNGYGGFPHCIAKILQEEKF